MEEGRISNRVVNGLLTESLRTNTLKGTWVDMEEIPKIINGGEDVVMIVPTRGTLVTKVDELTMYMRRAQTPYRHIPWIKGQYATTLAFKVVGLESGKVCYCVSEQNLNILKQIKADKHHRIF